MRFGELEDRRSDNLEKIKHICKCSCRVYIPVYVDSVICKACGRRIYRTPQIEFKEKLKRTIVRREIYESFRV